MPTSRRRLSKVCVAAIAAIAALLFDTAGATDWVSYEQGVLSFERAENGDAVPDFSEAGFGPKGAAIPLVAGVVQVSPSHSEGDLASIQAAIDAVAAMPMDERGFRGAVELTEGEFRIEGTIEIRAAGIVLRGGGAEDGGTTLLFEGATGPVIDVRGVDRWRASEAPRRIVGEYLPVGATTLRLESTRGLLAGDRVVVQRPFTEAWISQIGMDRLPPKPSGTLKQWQPGPGIELVRRIVAVSGDEIVIDSPVMDAISADDGGVVWKFRFPGELRNVGIESLRIDGTPVAPRQKTSHAAAVSMASIGISLNQGADIWIKNIAFRNLANYITIGTYASDVTADNVYGVNDVEPWWSVPPSAFSADGQRILFRRCKVSGNFINLVATQSLAGGPIVFQECTGSGQRVDAGPHQRWAVGVLFDNVVVPGTIAIRNRGNMGSGHGWAGANTVVWNSIAGQGILAEAPPTAHTWVFGSQGPLLPTKEAPAEFISHGVPLSPKSLFDAQLNAPD